MGDDQHLYLNGVDLSAFVKDIKVSPEPTANIEDGLLGLKRIGPITITGYFDDGRSFDCGLCRQRTARQESGDAAINHPSLGRIEVCAECMVGLMDGGIINS